MTSVPDSIRQEVLIQWLQGTAWDMIAKNVDIEAGTVSRIVRRYCEEDPDFNTLRRYVVSVKNQGAGVKQLAPAMRLDRRLKKLDLSKFF